MGTKNNPGQFDCYAAADPDEPLFTLAAHDPVAHALVELWAHLRCCNISAAVFCFGYLVAEAIKRPLGRPAKVDEAYACAEAMRRWYVEHLD